MTFPLSPIFQKAILQLKKNSGVFLPSLKLAGLRNCLYWQVMPEQCYLDYKLSYKMYITCELLSIILDV